ncbi:S-layer homology domain-containing protein [Solibacillus sp. FSL R7-0682]|uniref:S-layer homology domain-containing protein n=1 Tax=Solibacillus sp. FSL R7-0682 TaxID=2921690 RepID=UPI0030FA2FF3
MQASFKKLLLVSIMFMLVIANTPQRANAAAYDPTVSFENLDVRFWEDQQPDIGFYINASSRYILETVTAPSMGSTFGEWSVMDLLRGMYTGYDYINHIPANYFSDYLGRIEAYVDNKNGMLDRNKSTEWSRLTLALTALGYPITNVAGHDFVEYLSRSHSFSYRQGINGPIWEIIALDTGGYELYPDPSNDDVNTVGKMIDYILNMEISNGGWALSGGIPDPDITAMALQAFAPYYLNSSRYDQTGASATYQEFAQAVERAIVKLSEIQLLNGGYDSWGSINSESIVQVIVALTAMNMDPLATSILLPNINQTVDFITEGKYEDGVWTNNMIDALLTFWANGSGSSPEVGGFKHVTAGYDGGGGSGTSVNAMATDQALYGLIAYDRFKKSEKSLYDMSDMQNGEYQYMTASNNTIYFDGNQVGESSSKTVSPYAVVDIPSSSAKDFVAWNTKQDGTGTTYMPNERLVMPDEDVTLYAQTSSTMGNMSDGNIQKVINLIDELPTVGSITKEHENKIKQARAAFNRLTVPEQRSVTNLSKLVTLEGLLSGLLSQYDDELKVENLIKTIDSLYNVSNITLDYQIAIENARIAYNILTATQRLQITNYWKLESLEAKLKVAEDLDKKETTVANVIWLIDNLPKVEQLTRADKEKVREAIAYYEALSADQKKNVTNYSKLTKLEERLKVLEKEALEKEELEDEIDSDVFDEMVVNGKTLTIHSAKTAGEYSVTIPAETLQSSIKKYGIKNLIVKDTRGVTLSMSTEQLVKELQNNKNAQTVKFQISTFDYQNEIFTVDFSIKLTNKKKVNIKLNDGYISLKVPYNYFLNGKKLKDKYLLEVGSDNPTIPHVSTDKAVTIKLKQGGKFLFNSNNIFFTDIGNVSNADEILYLANRQVIKGSDNGTFAPNNDITRGQFAVMIARALKLQASGKTSYFVDTKGKWYEQEVQAIVEAGIAKGTSPATFNPEGKLTRQEAASLMVNLLRYVKFDVDAVLSRTPYTDAHKIAKYARADVGILNTLDIMTGNTKGEFAPTVNLKRSQMAKVLKRTLNIAEMM